MYKASISESESEIAQSCRTLCDPMDSSLPGSSVHEIFQTIVLEWIAISFSRGSSHSKDRTRVSHVVDRHYRLSHQGSTRKSPKARVRRAFLSVSMGDSGTVCVWKRRGSSHSSLYFALCSSSNFLFLSYILLFLLFSRLVLSNSL